nr:MAG TPA: hypothetical protein [Caudoviricetes sp.]
MVLTSSCAGLLKPSTSIKSITTCVTGSLPSWPRSIKCRTTASSLMPLEASNVHSRNVLATSEAWNAFIVDPSTLMLTNTWKNLYSVIVKSYL